MERLFIGKSTTFINDHLIQILPSLNNHQPSSHHKNDLRRDEIVDEIIKLELYDLPFKPINIPTSSNSNSSNSSNS